MQKRAFLALAAIAWLGCDKLEKKDAPEQSAPEVASKTAPVEPETKKEAGDTKATPLVDPTEATPLVEAPPADANTADERNTIEVFRAAAPATVFVTQKTLRSDFFARKVVEVPAGAGTGFVWDEQGHIVTNCHVALPNCESRGAPPKVSVTLFDQKSYDATLVGIDPFKDIAVLRIDAKDSKLTPIRRPPKGYGLEVGQKTVAIGNPFGLDHTLTVGVVSALGREVKGVAGVTIRGMVQTDAAINPGNSGGPLLDSRGQLIGMNTMIFSTSGSAAGIGFAVPVDSIDRIVPQIIRTGFPERIGLGIAPHEEFARRVGIAGVVIGSINSGSPAEKAGLVPLQQTASGITFDVIVGVDDKKIESFDDLVGSLEDKLEGDKVRVQVRRFPRDEVVAIEIAVTKLGSQ